MARNGADSLGGMAEHDFSDHRQAAQMHLEAAEQGFEHMEDKGDAAMLYAQLGIGHALMRISDVLDRISDDLNEIRCRGR